MRGVLIEQFQPQANRWQELWRGELAAWLHGAVGGLLDAADRAGIEALGIGQSYEFHWAEAMWRVTAVVAAWQGDGRGSPLDFEFHYQYAGQAATCNVRLAPHPEEATVVIGLRADAAQFDLAAPGVTEAVVSALCRQQSWHPSHMLVLRQTGARWQELSFMWQSIADTTGEWQAVAGSGHASTRTARAGATLLALDKAETEWAV